MFSGLVGACVGLDFGLIRLELEEIVLLDHLYKK